MTASYSFELGCPLCGGDIDHVAGGCPSERNVRAVAWCPECLADVLIVVAVDARRNPRRATPARREQLARARNTKEVLV